MPGRPFLPFAEIVTGETPQPMGPPVMPQPRVPADRGEEPPPFEEADIDATLFNQEFGSADVAQGMREALRPEYSPTARPMGKVVMGADYARVGGPDRLDQAYDATNARGQEAIQEAADIQTKEAASLEEHYKNQTEEANRLRATRLAHQQENILAQQQKQAELEKQTKVYSQNLADRGAFWKNPGNVISAIGFALMPLAGVGNDVGIKLIHNAVQQDLENRRGLASGHLGMLKSNLSGYRQLAQDIEAGDALAEAEAYRIAGLEIQRIAAGYQGQKAQTTAKALQAQLNGKMNEAYMQAFNRMININPQRLPQDIAAAQEGRLGYYNQMPGKQGSGGRAPGMPGQPISPQAPGVPSPGGSPAGNTPAGYGSGGAGGIPVAKQQAAVTALGGKVTAEKWGGAPATESAPSKWRPGDQLGPGAQVAAAEDQPEGGPGRDSWLEKKNPGLAKAVRNRVPYALETWEIVKNELLIRARNKTLKEHNPQTNPDGFNRALQANWEEEFTKADTQKAVIATNVKDKAANYQTYSLIQKDMNEIEKAFGGDQNKINDWLFGASGSVVAPTITKDLREFWKKQGKEDVAERGLAAADRFKQLVGGVVASYYHDMAGAAMSDNELKILKGALSQNPSWQEARNHVGVRSKAMANEYSSIIQTANDPVARKLYLLENSVNKASRLPSGGQKPKGPGTPWGGEKEGVVDPRTNRVQIRPKSQTEPKGGNPFGR